MLIPCVFYDLGSPHLVLLIVSWSLLTKIVSTLIIHTIHRGCLQQRRSGVVHRSRPSCLLLVCTEVYYSRLDTSYFILQKTRVHDQSSNKVVSLGQDPNPVHSPPMIELGLEGQLTCGEFDL